MKEFILMAEIQIAGPLSAETHYQWGERFSQSCWAAFARSMIQQRRGFGGTMTGEDFESTL
jgi:hypothetical protein